jgi:HAD superfamily hydrolase (TIGR01549 family)
MTRAVLFDLDDTLFDHGGCARAALEGVKASQACLAQVPFAELERAHSRFLEELHVEVLAGRMGLDDAREERFRRLLACTGVEATAERAAAAAAAYREHYLASRRAVAGAAALLPAVRSRARIGIVTNNLRNEQEDKLRVCGLLEFVDALVVSEEAGVAKPDPAIFRIALDRLGCEPGEAVMVGDSWAADVIGARAIGIRPIWFNPDGALPPDASVPVLRALEPIESVLQLLFNPDDAHRD